MAAENQIDLLASRVRAALDGIDVPARVSVDRESGIIKVYGPDADALKKASSGLEDVLELAYTTAEHHPYWGILYHATEICKMVLEKWDSNLTADQTGDILWRCDEIKMMAERVQHMHED